MRSIPLISNLVYAIYAGAAMHCWSDPHNDFAVCSFWVENTRSIYAIPVIGFCRSIKILYTTLLVKTKTPENPLVLSFVAVALTIIGFVCSII